jgi:hypothetical protein
MISLGHPAEAALRQHTGPGTGRQPLAELVSRALTTAGRPEWEKLGKEQNVTTNADEPLSFETDVKPLFRERDRRSMEFAFDLWSHDDVSEHADDIIARLDAGTMPCDGAWSKAQVDLFRRWIQSGKAS